MSKSKETFYYGLCPNCKSLIELSGVEHSGAQGSAVENYYGFLPCGKVTHAKGFVSKGLEIPDYVTPLSKFMTIPMEW